MQLPLPSAPLADDPINEPLINIEDKEPIYKWCLMYAGIFCGGGAAICLLVYFCWH